jgi:hypothetical protein
MKLYERVGQSVLRFGAMVCLTSSLWLGGQTLAHAASLSFSVNGTNSATGTSLLGWANFVFDPNTNKLSVQVINGSGNAVATTDVLGAVFFKNTQGGIVFTPLNAKMTANSTLWNPPGSYNLGKEWQFRTGIAGPNSTNTGIASNTYGGLFSTGNFASPGNSVSGLNYGIANGIASNASNAVKTAVLVQNEMTYDFSVSSGFTLDSIKDVYFQFGTSLTGPRLFATLSVPEPGTVALFASMSMSGLAVGLRRRRLRKSRRATPNTK